MRRQVLIGVALFALLAAVPLLGDAYALRIGTTMLMYGVLAMSWNFIGGMAGYPSFATAAFFGLGAYVGAVMQKFGVPFVLAIPVGTSVTFPNRDNIRHADASLHGGAVVTDAWPLWIPY